MKLNGKSVVVTGASSGMGKAIVELFVKEGANVVAVARRKERLETLVESLKGEAGQVVYYVGDVSKKDIQSETLSRHSVTYATDSTEADLDEEFGVPKKHTAFLKRYKKARFQGVLI